MAHRVVTDPRGIAWDVWEVFPSEPGRRAARKRVPSSDSRSGQRNDVRVVVSEQLKNGWLAFQSKNERRRLAPVPSGWDSFDDERIVALLTEAEVVGRPKRLIE
jgi:hypothetical protein